MGDFFGTVQLPDWNQMNQFYNPDVVTARQNNALAGSQDLADRATVRGVAGGLAAGVTNGTTPLTPENQAAYASAMGTAMSLGRAGVPSVNAMANLQQSQASIGLERLKMQGMMPVSPFGNVTADSGQSGGAGQSAATADGSAPAGGPLKPGQSLFTGTMPVSADSATQQRVGQVAQAAGVNPDWAMRVQNAESGTFKDASSAVSPAKARGAMQLMPGTAAGLGVDPSDPEQNIAGGVKYLAQMKSQFGDPVIATAAYNAGPGRVSDWLAGKSPLPAETIKYVGRIFGSDGGAILNQALSGAHGHPVPGQAIASHTDGAPVLGAPAPAVPAGTQVASIPATTMTDASPNAGPDPAAGSVASASPGQVQSLLNGYRRAPAPSPAAPAAPAQPASPDAQVAVDPAYAQARNAPVQGQGMTAQQAVQQARTELDGSLANADPATYQAAITQRAQTLLAGGSGVAPAASAPAGGQQALPPQAVPATQQAAPVQVAAAGQVPPMLAPQAPQGAAPQQQGQEAPGQSAQVQSRTMFDAQPGGPVNGIPGATWFKNAMGGFYVPPNSPPGTAAYKLNGQMHVTQLMPPELKIEKGVDAIYGIDPRDSRLVAKIPITSSARLTTVQAPDGTHVLQGPNDIRTYAPSTQAAQTAMMQHDNEAVVPQLSQQGILQENQLQKTMEARNAAVGLPTGSGFDGRQAVSNYLQTYWPSAADAIKSKYGDVLPDASQSQQVGKLLLSQAQADEKSSGVAQNGGIGLATMFANSNPNLGMQPDAIRDMLNMKAVQAMAGKDYVQGKIDHINTNTASRMSSGSQYVPTAAYEKAWFSQNNANTYMGAINAMNGQPFTQWSKGLKPEDATRALGVIARIDPTATVMGRDGHPLPVSGFVPANAANPSGTVAR